MGACGAGVVRPDEGPETREGEEEAVSILIFLDAELGTLFGLCLPRTRGGGTLGGLKLLAADVEAAEARRFVTEDGPPTLGVKPIRVKTAVSTRQQGRGGKLSFRLKDSGGLGPTGAVVVVFVGVDVAILVAGELSDDDDDNLIESSLPVAFSADATDERPARRYEGTT
ncbi:hypothetical protein HDV05_000093 [Chytridiales sp. JEL 0842]|nr:hypothetical protein HDV05_000093 [Chytridiales sp. JEL 0842]